MMRLGLHTDRRLTSISRAHPVAHRRSGKLAPSTDTKTDPVHPYPPAQIQLSKENFDMSYPATGTRCPLIGRYSILDTGHSLGPVPVRPARLEVPPPTPLRRRPCRALPRFQMCLESRSSPIRTIPQGGRAVAHGDARRASTMSQCRRPQLRLCLGGAFAGECTAQRPERARTDNRMPTVCRQHEM
jgi:hypothetical protein